MDLRWISLVLLLLCCTAPPVDPQPEDVKPRYQKFLLQHVYGSMTAKKCTSEIKKRGITDANGNCKDVNTFALANSNQVRAVCTGGGTPRHGNRDLYDSNQPFSVITCNLRSGLRPPKCEYRDGVKSTRYITVACDRGWPVHYDGDIVDV